MLPNRYRLGLMLLLSETNGIKIKADWLENLSLEELLELLQNYS